MHEGARPAFHVRILDGYETVAAGADTELGRADDVVIEIRAHQRKDAFYRRCVGQGLVGVGVVAAGEIQVATHLTRAESVAAFESDDVTDVLRPAQPFTQTDATVGRAVGEELANRDRLEVAGAEASSFEICRRWLGGMKDVGILKVAARHQAAHGVCDQDDCELGRRSAGEPYLVEKYGQIRSVAVHRLPRLADHAGFGIVVAKNPQGSSPVGTGVGNRPGDGAISRVDEASEGVLVIFFLYQPHHGAFEDVHFRLRAGRELELSGAEVEAVIGQIEGGFHLGPRHRIAPDIDDGVVVRHVIGPPCDLRRDPGGTCPSAIGRKSKDPPDTGASHRNRPYSRPRLGALPAGPWGRP